MKPALAPHVSRNTDAERFDDALQTIFRVSKPDVVKAETNERRMKARKKRAKRLA